MSTLTTRNTQRAFHLKLSRKMYFCINSGIGVTADTRQLPYGISRSQVRLARSVKLSASTPGRRRNIKQGGA